MENIVQGSNRSCDSTELCLKNIDYFGYKGQFKLL